MKFIDEFRQKNLAEDLLSGIRKAAKISREYRLMEFCGGHTHAIFRHGLQGLLPENVTFIHGPGCPVCILPSGRIAAILTLLEQQDVTICTYGDVLRVPTEGGESLHKARARGADIRVIYSPLDCLAIARQQHKPVIFFAVGFETTAPATAALVKHIQLAGCDNLFVYCNHVLTPAALNALLATESAGERRFDGIIGPSHVTTITGFNMYQPFAELYRIPIVVAGFEPLDILQATLMLIHQLNAGEARVENEYTRAVSAAGNGVAQQLMDDVFCVREQFEWRGLGILANSGLALNTRFQDLDAEVQFELVQVQQKDVKACECPAILRGAKRPQDCKLFGTSCRPDNPLGACMVSSEGACAAQWQYQRFSSVKIAEPQ